MNERFYILLPLILAGEAGTDEEKEFFDLLDRYPELQQEYRQSLMLWLASESRMYDAEKALAGIKPSDVQGPRLRIKRYRIPAIAASVLLLLGLGYIIATQVNLNGNSPAGMQYAASGNEVMQTRLPDGSVVWLNRHSELWYPENFGKGERRVKVKGEAYFDIAPDAERPFITESGSSETRVLGTEYLLREDAASGIHLMVTEGKVLFRKSGQPDGLTIGAGQAALLEQGRNMPAAEDSEPNRLAWKTGEMVFNSAAPSHVFAILESVYGLQYHTLLPADTMRFTGTFRRRERSEVQDILSETLQISFLDSAGGVWVKPAP